MMVHFNRPFAEWTNKRIDIWWRGKDSNGDLMLLLAYLIQLNSKWKKTRINVISIADNETDRQQLEKLVDYSIKEARIDAKGEVMLRTDDKILEQLLNKSKDADLVFTGLARDLHDLDERARRIEHIAKKLKVVAFVQNNGMRSVTPMIFSNANDP